MVNKTIYLSFISFAIHIRKMCYVTITFYSHLLQTDCYSPLAVMAYPGFTMRKASIRDPQLLPDSLDHNLSTVCRIFTLVLKFLLQILKNTNLNTVKRGLKRSTTTKIYNANCGQLIEKEIIHANNL